MTDYLIHKSKTGIANTAEWQETDMHQLQNQAAGDILYAADGTHLTRLAKQTNGNKLVLASGLPAWASSKHTHMVDTEVDGGQLNSYFLAELNRRPTLYRRYNLSAYYMLSTLTGSGGFWNATPDTFVIYTGVTNSSTAIAYYYDEAPANYYTEIIPWSKRRIIGFSVILVASAATCVRTIQFKNGYAIGDLAVTGIEIYFDNLDVYGGSYATGLSKTTKLFTATDNKWYRIMIDHQPAVPKIDFYIDTGSGFPAFGSPTATISTSNNIPQVDASTSCYVCYSISKGAVDAYCYLGLIDMWSLYP
jgi:hypothetical protein